MSETPWIKFFASDWLGGTSGLTAAERGVYITILALIYENNGPIPHDENRLSRRCGITKGAFVKVLKGLLDEGKLILADGRLSNRRAEVELKERQNRSEKASQSANERWSKAGKKSEQDQGPGNANASAKQCLDDANQKPEPELEGDGANAPSRRAAKKAALPAKSRMTPDWPLSDEGRDFARAHGLTDDQTEEQLADFRIYWMDRRDRDASKSVQGWEMTWRNRIKLVTARIPKHSPNIIPMQPKGRTNGQQEGFRLAIERRRARGMDFGAGDDLA